jgi:hypothetical protein
MNTPGARVIRSSGKLGLLSGGQVALFNSSGDCPDCCCNPTDVLIVTCNQNRITDDDYTVKLNGNVVGAVAHIGDTDTGCVSPGDGLWSCTDPSIVPGVLSNESDMLGGACSACLEDAAWTMGTLNPAWLAASNELVVTVTSDEGCGDWGTVAAWAVDAKNKKLCYPLTSGAYVGLNGPLPYVMFDGTFDWNPLP